jgi:flagellar protein FlaF
MLLLKAASRLQAAYDGWDANKGGLEDALLFNRRLWALLMAAVTKPENPLPTIIRQNVANLGIFIMNQTVEMREDPKPEQLSPLISINRNLAAGLMGQA